MIYLTLLFGLPRWLSGKESVSQSSRHRFNPWVRKIPWRRKWQPTLAFLPGKSHGWRSLAWCSPWGHKESDTNEQLALHYLECVFRNTIKIPSSSLFARLEITLKL